MIRDPVVFHFKGEEQPLRTYIEQVFATAQFLQYAVTEQEQVDRVVMNFNPSMLNHAAFVDRPHSRTELYKVVAGIVNDLLEQEVVRPSKSPYASPALLVPKGGDAFRMVVDYRKVNAKIVFDSYPMPTIDQAFNQLGGAVVFSVFDLNMAYHQIPLSARSRRATAFCTPF
jgi:hypothetical protein